MGERDPIVVGSPRHVKLGLAAAAIIAVVVAAIYLRRPEPPPAPSPSPRSPSAHFTALEGGVQVKPRGSLKWIAGRRLMSLADGDLVWTPRGSAAQIEFLNGFVFDVRPDSLVTIEALAGRGQGAGLGVGSGAVSGEAPNPGVGAEINTPGATWDSARGDEPPSVDVLVKPSMDTTISQRRGRGQVTPRNGSTRMLGPHSAVGIDAKGVPGPTLTLPEAPRLIMPAPATTLSSPDPKEAVVRLVWQGPPGTASYHLLVDRGGFFLHPLADETVTRGTSWELTNLEEGKYYWKVATVTAAGESFSDFARFTMARSPVASPPILIIERLELRGRTIQITGRTQPGVTLTVNGERVDVQPDGTFNEYLALIRSGTQVVVMRATGTDGSVTEQTRSVTVP